MKKERIPAVSSDPLLSRLIEGMFKGRETYGVSLDTMRDIQELEARFGNRADQALFDAIYARVGGASYNSYAFRSLYVSGHMPRLDPGTIEYRAVRGALDGYPVFAYQREALHWMSTEDITLVSRPVQLRIQTLFRNKGLAWPTDQTENRKQRLLELRQSLLSPEFQNDHPQSALAAAKWIKEEGRSPQGDFDAIVRYNAFRAQKEAEDEARHKKNMEDWQRRQALARAAQEEAALAPPPPVTPPPVTDRVELVMMALSKSNRLPPRLPSGKGDGSSFSVGKVLLDDATPLDVFRLAFRDPMQINRLRVGWSSQSRSEPRSAVYATCARAAGKTPSKTWKARLDILLSVLPELEFATNRTTPMHLLAGAVFSDPTARLSAMRAMERLFRKAQERRHPELPPFSAWMATDSSGATPFMRAVRAGDAKLAHALFLLHPASAVPDDHGEVLAAVVGHLPSDQGEGLVSSMKKLRPVLMSEAHIEQALTLISKDSLDAWRNVLASGPATTKEVDLRRSRIPDIVPGTGTILPVLNGALRARPRR